MASITPMSFFTPDASINPDEYTFEITDAAARADILSILSDISTVESSTTASKAYAVGDYLVYNNNFYRVTSAILQGGTIVTSGNDANVEQITLTSQISDLFTGAHTMQSNIAYVEDGETASKDYVENSYLMRGGVFYKAIATILAGDTFDSGEGGNITHVDVASQFGSGGGGSTGCVELTQAQYDALSEEAKMLDVIYLITDSPDNYLDEIFGDFASVEYTNTASKAYAVGDYLMYNSKFYRVTSAIAQGGTITPNTNVVQTTVGNEVKFGFEVPKDTTVTVPIGYYQISFLHSFDDVGGAYLWAVGTSWTTPIAIKASSAVTITSTTSDGNVGTFKWDCALTPRCVFTRLM